MNSFSKPIALVPFLISSFALLAAYYYQYFEGLEPCTLCIWQRVPHFFVIALSIIYFWKRNLILVIGMALASLMNLGISLYHVGVENKIFSGLNSCGSESLIGLTKEQLIERLSSAPVAKCNFVSWELFGISMAGWNCILVFATLLVIGYMIRVILIRSKPL